MANLHPGQLPSLERPLSSAVTGKADWGGPALAARRWLHGGSYWEQSSTLGGPHKSWREGNLRMVIPPRRRGGGKKHSSYIRGVPNQDCFVCFYYIYIFNMYKSNIFKIYKSNIRPL